MRRENWEEKKERKRLSKPSCGYAADTCHHGREQLQSEFQQHQEKPSSELVRGRIRRPNMIISSHTST